MRIFTMKLTACCLAIVICLGSPAFAEPETVRVATYNIENWHQRFLGNRMGKPEVSLPDTPEVKQLLDAVKKANDEDNWQIAQVILDPAFSPDVLVVQEGCRQEDLQFFNKRWLSGAYETLITFPSNTNRDQHLNLLLKPGFKVLDRRDQYHTEPDPAADQRGGRLFARGPAFALIETPGGHRFWVGTTHQKSKSGNSREVTEWRNREAVRTRQILKELETGDPHPVVLLGDMNDELGIQEFEIDGGGDTIANLIGSNGEALFHLATRPLGEAGEVSFGGYWNPRFRSLIDHVVVSKSLKDQIEDVRVISHGLAPVASDHYPVMIQLKLGETK
jgi:endonuclease/exonuclease/phosphatase family metal-dependent hydrolase